MPRVLLFSYNTHPLCYVADLLQISLKSQSRYNMILAANKRPILLAGLPAFFSQLPHLPHFQNPDITTIWGVLLLLLRCATFMEMWEGLAFIENRTSSKDVGERAPTNSTILKYFLWIQYSNVIEAWGVHLTSKISSPYPWEMKHQNWSTYC